MKGIIIYFILFLVIAIIAISIYEVAKGIHIRWLLQSILFFTTILTIAIFSKEISSVMSILFFITFFEFIWFTWRSFKIRLRIGLIDAIESDYSVAGYHFCAQWILVCIGIWKVPIIWICSKFNYIINIDKASAILYAVYFFCTVITYHNIFKGYKQIKKKFKTMGMLSRTETLEISFSDEIKGKESYVENILIRMKKRKFIYKLDFIEEIYLYKELYNIFYKDIRNNESKQTIYNNISSRYKILNFNQIYNYLYNEIKDDNKIVHSQKYNIVPDIKENESKNNNGNNDLSKKNISKIDTDNSNIVKDKSMNNINTIENSINESEVINNMLPQEEMEFMLLRNVLSNHPLIQEDEKIKSDYLHVLNYLISDVTSLDKAWNEKIKEYESLFNIKIDRNANLIDIDNKIKSTSKKIYKFKGFLQLNIKDYKYLLILEALYYKSILRPEEIKPQMTDNISKKFKINKKDFSWINKYYNTMFINKNSKEAEMLILNCKNNYIRNTVLYIHNNAEWNNICIKLPKVNVAVCATMSSGKSTFVNALLGKDFIPSKNEACTAKVTTIRDNDKIENLIGCYYKDDESRVCSNNIKSEDLIKWNEDDSIQRTVLESDIEEIECGCSIIVIHDTPGTNNSQDISHYERTMNFLKESNIDIMLYIINAEHISTTDTEILIKQLKSEVIDNRNTKVLFLLNKADSFDIERGEELIDITKKIEAELVSYGFIKPLITPISSNAARLFKMVLNGTELTKKEINDFNNLMEYFSDEQMNFSLYKNFNQEIKKNKKYVFGNEQDIVKVGKKEYTRNDIIKALQYTGINIIESWLDQQIN